MNYKKELEQIREQLGEINKVKSELTIRTHELDKQIRKKEINENKYSEGDLYDFAMNYMGPRYYKSKRLDIIHTWARKLVEEFKEGKNQWKS